MMKKKILFVCGKEVRQKYFMEKDICRLEQFADWDWVECNGGEPFGANTDPHIIGRVRKAVLDVDGIVVAQGAPQISNHILDNAPRLKIIGELEGDRFSERIDLQVAWDKNIVTVDTTNGSSYPVSEWALGLILVSLKNAGSHFRKIIGGSITTLGKDDFGYVNGELYEKRVGLIGCGHIGRRLIKFLKPFNVKLKVFDPYIPSEMADILGFTKTSLDKVMSESDVVACLAPLTPGTKGMIGERELNLLQPNTVFVNVSRGAIVDSDALIKRLRRGDIVAGLDVFDPEPIPVESEIRNLSNAFLSPHVAGVTKASYTRFFTLMVEEFNRFFQGHQTRFDLTPKSISDRAGL
jgi:D-3-phosphoglycerate dehydrogenase